MRIAIIVDSTTGQIKGYTLPGNEDDLPEGLVIGPDHVRWSDQFGAAPTDLTVTHRFDLSSETFVEKAARPADSEHTYNWTSHEWEFDSTAFWVNVRAQRDLKLGLCDWTQGADSPLTAEKKAEWATYRTALRNVPANNTSVTVYGNITWPTEPS
jgi:hypothetical protein